MALANSPALYGGVAKTFHWLTALLILTALPLGVIANNLPFETDAELARKAWVFSLHKTVGVTAFFVALARIFWALTQPKPAPLHPDRKIETTVAEIVHWLLYASLVLVPLSGWLHHAATAGFAPIWWPFGQTLPLVPQNGDLAHFFAALHFVFTKVLAASVILHIVGAAKHALIDKDLTLKRMTPGTCPEPDISARHTSRMPVVAATAIYAAALGLGTVIGLPSESQATQPPVAVPATSEAGDWVVEDGALGLTIGQLGSPVSGSFGDWNAAITFDPEATGEVMGQVEVSILIPSLTLGSVSDQAMGPDFFDSGLYPVADYRADIRRNGEAFIADGTLSLKGRDVPVSLPFTLQIDGDTATMAGSTTLDRRDFGIGETYTDESSLAFPVEITVSLTARQTP